MKFVSCVQACHSECVRKTSFERLLPAQLALDRLDSRSLSEAARAMRGILLEGWLRRLEGPASHCGRVWRQPLCGKEWVPRSEVLRRCIGRMPGCWRARDHCRLTEGLVLRLLCGLESRTELLRVARS